VGNALEIEECIDCLTGNGPADLMDITYELGAEMLVMGGRADDVESGKQILRSIIGSAQGLDKFRDMVRAQGGDPAVADDPKRILPQADFRTEVKAGSEGYVAAMDAREVGMAAVTLGCGRLRMDDIVDPAVGFAFSKKIGDHVDPKETLVTVHANERAKGEIATKRLQQAIRISSRPAEPPALIKERL
jgi:pyrimidine-nucleoside phosphorylase